MPRDVRFIEVDEIEIRTDEGSDERAVEGFGILYDREVEIWPGFFERIQRGAFDKTLHGSAQPEVKSFFNHDPSAVLATTRSKPRLLLEDTEKGLRFKAPIPPTTYGNDLRVNLERKNVRGASFTFSVAPDGDTVTRDEKGNIHRTVTKGSLYEIGPVTNPAYPQTKVGLRSGEMALEDIKRSLDAQAQTADEERESEDNARIMREMITKTREREAFND